MVEKKKKVIFLVIDGLADLPIDKKTPLSESEKPNMNYFAKNGVVGELRLVPKNIEVASHIANISLLGYNPKKYYLKRGPLEAIGANIPYTQGNLALRCNFATVDKELIVKDRRAGRSTYGLDELARYINENVKLEVPFVLMRTYGHRAVLVIKMDLSDNITDSDPEVSGERVRKISAFSNDALISAKIVQEFLDKSHEIIEYHPINAERIARGIPPANYILTRDAGNRVCQLPSFLKKHGINKAVCIAENGVMKATCMLAGFDSITIKETGFEEGLKLVFDNIETSLPEYDFVYAHIKGVDESAHDGKFEEKKERIERIDEMLEDFKNFKGILVITCDHITSCEKKSHTHGPVPVLVFGKGKDRIKTFDEFSVKNGKLRNITGKELMEYIFK
ncbi:MAG: 2,3-bisphosphoglycerate-independent phosphoglycerate mutase [Candidatus Aenigmatarchaeota archaeon]